MDLFPFRPLLIGADGFGLKGTLFHLLVLLMIFYGL